MIDIKPCLQERLLRLLILSVLKATCLPPPNLTRPHFLPGVSYYGTAETVLVILHEGQRASRHDNKQRVTASNPARDQSEIQFTFDFHPEEKLSRNRPR